MFIYNMNYYFLGVRVVPDLTENRNYFMRWLVRMNSYDVNRTFDY